MSVVLYKYRLGITFITTVRTKNGVAYGGCTEEQQLMRGYIASLALILDFRTLQR